MKKAKILSFSRLFILFAALIFEILPYGAVCVFATPEEKMRRLFSYFSLVPYGYANFAPFITAILTCILLILALISLLSSRSGLEKGLLFVSLAASVISLAPLLFGIEFFSIVGAIISALLFATFTLSFSRRCEYE